MCWESVLDKVVGDITSDQWNEASNIIIDKPQSLDKRVAGQVLLGEGRLNRSIGEEVLGELKKLVPQKNADGHKEQDEQSGCDKNLWNKVSAILTDQGVQTDSPSVFKLQKLVSRNPGRFADFYRIIVIENLNLTFINIDEDSVPYKVTHREGVCELSAYPKLKDAQKVWLETRLMVRFASWLTETLSSHQSSLRLVDLEKYCREYNRLKTKYAESLISNWKESSDPEKSVHEDLGIAAYLNCLWEGSKVRFVDLGCGNGLLVYILSGEGHKGTGYDLRRRGIWNWFPSKPNLKEEAVVPGLETRFEEVDWILGNHSDELTPWIPVFSCLSGPSTRYWVLPCCPFDFTHKYQRRDAKESVFRDYLNFVTEIGELAGFEVKEDKMRIPSTKRICLVGSPTGEENYEKRKQKILEFVTSKSTGFRPREKVEMVRNCTQIGTEIITKIVKLVVDICLETRNDINKTSGKTWNSGGEFNLGDVVRRLQEKEVDLSKLKSECGGLQTLLRNHRSIFHVEKGKVKLRVPGTSVPKVANPKVKSKDCWFFVNHPDGCLLEDEMCTWIHPT